MLKIEDEKQETRYFFAWGYKLFRFSPHEGFITMRYYNQISFLVEKAKNLFAILILFLDCLVIVIVEKPWKENLIIHWNTLFKLTILLDNHLFKTPTLCCCFVQLLSRIFFFPLRHQSQYRLERGFVANTTRFWSVFIVWLRQCRQRVKKGWLKIKNPEHVQIICFNDPFSSCRFLMKIDGIHWGQVEALKKENNPFFSRMKQHTVSLINEKYGIFLIKFLFLLKIQRTNYSVFFFSISLIPDI